MKIQEAASVSTLVRILATRQLSGDLICIGCSMRVNECRISSSTVIIINYYWCNLKLQMLEFFWFFSFCVNLVQQEYTTYEFKMKQL